MELILFIILIPHILGKTSQIYNDYHLPSWNAMENIQKKNNFKLIINVYFFTYYNNIILRQKFMGMHI